MRQSVVVGIHPKDVGKDINVAFVVEGSFEKTAIFDAGSRKVKFLAVEIHLCTCEHKEIFAWNNLRRCGWFRFFPNDYAVDGRFGQHASGLEDLHVERHYRVGIGMRHNDSSDYKQ